ncbi:MAG TPA: cation diffusion facilitator family transporter [Pyrinomonadaceae bacterium]|jgi:cobalt-zinc-cadmium efflux system protein|nr:cation diffusion facilitator family transporter [Pyrinomonadaceae bacterium]
MGHSHGSTPTVTGRRLSLSIAITILFVLVEAISGYFSRSLALLSDAGHNFADALALVFSWYALWIARKPSTAQRTFGYHRVGILAALVNAVSLVVIALLIFWEAGIRLRDPEPVQSTPMIVVALLALLMNAGISLWLKSAAKNDLNVRSAYLHMLGDAISAAGVVAAGVIVAFTGAAIADPLVSILIGVLILWSSWGILKESVNVLLEGIPKGMNMAEVKETIAGVHGVLAVHDLHVWTVGSGMVCCSCHVMVNEQSVRSGENVLRAVTEELAHHFGIAHTTIQVEVEGCEPNDMYCVTRAARSSER